MKIVVAEDTPTQAAMVKLSLQRLGHTIVLASDGIDAIEKIYREVPDLVVSDVVMPRLDGYQVCRLLKDDPQTAAIPVVLLTSLDQRQDMFWGLKSGADRYITKGGDIPSLVKEIQEFIEERFPDGRTGGEEGAAAPEKRAVGFNVIERVIRLLDKNLFESTVINEIQNLVNTLDNYEKTVFSVMEILGKVIDFHAGCVYFAGDDQPEVHLLVNRSVDESFVGAFEEESHRLLALTTVVRGGDVQRVIHDPRGLLGEPGACPAQIGSLTSRPLFTQKEITGIIVLASVEEGAFNEKTAKTFDIITRQANIVIGYARLYERTKQLSITDGLTKVYNHRYFQEQLLREFTRSQRHRANLSLVLLDIDHFKRFNDTYGHQQGDVVLRELARALQNQIRSCDVLARYGGEEFAIIMPDAELELCIKAAERLRAVVEKLSIPGRDEELRVTISMGVASVPSPEIGTTAELVSAADQALYRAKEKGRNRVEC